LHDEIADLDVMIATLVDELAETRASLASEPTRRL
jgi:hypothetical protein